MANHVFICPMHGMFYINSPRLCPLQAVCTACQPPVQGGTHSVKFPPVFCSGKCGSSAASKPSSTVTGRIPTQPAPKSAAAKVQKMGAAARAAWTSQFNSTVASSIPTDTRTEMVERLNEILGAEYEVLDTAKIEADIKALAVAVLSILNPEPDKQSRIGRHIYQNGRCILCMKFRHPMDDPNEHCPEAD